MLRPPEIPDVVPELMGPLDQVGEVRVGQRDRPLRGQPAGDLDVLHGEPVPDAAGAGVQEQPDPVLLVEADLDEVVARAEGAQLEPPVRGDPLGAVDARVLLKGRHPGIGLGAVDGRVVVPRGQRDGALDGLPQCCKITTAPGIPGRELGPDGQHSAVVNEHPSCQREIVVLLHLQAIHIRSAGQELHRNYLVVVAVLALLVPSQRGGVRRLDSTIAAYARRCVEPYEVGCSATSIVGYRFPEVLGPLSHVMADVGGADACHLLLPDRDPRLIRVSAASRLF